MPATTGPSHGRQSLSQLLAVRSNARNGANALQWAIPAAICGRKGRGGSVDGISGRQGVLELPQVRHSHNARYVICRDRYHKLALLIGEMADF